MVLNTLRYMSNRSGIPRFESNSVSVGTASVVYSFTDAGTYFNNNFCGLVLLKFQNVIPSDTTTTLPVYINSTPVKTYGDADLTVAGFNGTGIYLAYYDGSSRTLQLLNS